MVGIVEKHPLANAANSGDARNIYQCIQTFDINHLTLILSKLDLRKSVEIVNMQDEAGYTLLHSAAYYNTFKIADYIITFFKRRFATYLKQRYLKRHNLPRNTQ